MGAQAGDDEGVQVWSCKARDGWAWYWHGDGQEELSIRGEAVDVASGDACGPVIAVGVGGCTVRSAHGVIQLQEFALV